MEPQVLNVMDNLRKIIMILRDYEEDTRIGYVINLEQYIKVRCEMLNITELKDCIINLINETKQVKTCKL